MADTLERVKKIIVEKLEVSESKVTIESSFMQDLGFDSLDVFDIVFAIEKEFDIEISDEKANEIETVGDVVKYLDAAIK